LDFRKIDESMMRPEDGSTYHLAYVIVSRFEASSLSIANKRWHCCADTYDRYVLAPDNQDPSEDSEYSNSTLKSIVF
jgi:hypothetical protein